MKLSMVRTIYLFSAVAAASVPVSVSSTATSYTLQLMVDQTTVCIEHMDCASDEKCKGHFHDKNNLGYTKKCRKQGRNCKTMGTKRSKRWGCASPEVCGTAVWPETKWSFCATATTTAATTTAATTTAATTTAARLQQWDERCGANDGECDEGLVCTPYDPYAGGGNYCFCPDETDWSDDNQACVRLPQWDERCGANDGECDEGLECTPDAGGGTYCFCPDETDWSDDNQACVSRAF